MLWNGFCKWEWLYVTGIFILKVKEKLLVLWVPFLQEFFMLSNLNRLDETAFNTSSSTKSPLEQYLTMPEVQWMFSDGKSQKSKANSS